MRRFMIYLLVTVLVMGVCMVSAFTISSSSSLCSGGQSQRAKAAPLFAGPLETVAEVASLASPAILAFVAICAFDNSNGMAALKAGSKRVVKNVVDLKGDFNNLAIHMIAVEEGVEACITDMAEVKDGISTLTIDMAEVKAEVTMLQEDSADLKAELETLTTDMAEVGDKWEAFTGRLHGVDQ
jgi:hypothetical protein